MGIPGGAKWSGEGLGEKNIWNIKKQVANYTNLKNKNFIKEIIDAIVP